MNGLFVFDPLDIDEEEMIRRRNLIDLANAKKYWKSIRIKDV